LIAEPFCDILISGAGDRHESGNAGIPMVTVTFTAVLHKEEDMYIAECPKVGTVSQGYSIEEAIVHLKEATELYLVEFPLPAVGKP
jgi:predicted RNase H-like HicB family nuclease